MDVINRNETTAFTTKDGSTIREILAYRNAVVQKQSLAEATIPIGKQTEAHYHPVTEEIYYLLSGVGLMAIEEETQVVRPGDGIAIPPGARHWHGSAPDTMMCHLAMSETDDKGNATTWLEPVSDGDYGKAPAKD